MLNTIIQIILALFLILIMAFIAYSIYDNEYIKLEKEVFQMKQDTQQIKQMLKELLNRGIK